MKVHRHHNISISNPLLSLRLWLLAIVIGTTFIEMDALDADYYASKSQLASGYWVKVSVTNSGMHQITYDELRNWGFGNPSAVSVFGYGGNILPETFSSSHIDDLNPLPILHSDGKILFYAQGAVSWTFDTKTQEYKHTQNPYSTVGYYFLTDSKSIATPTQREGGDTSGKTDITSFREHAVYEKEQFSPGSTGRLFLGDDFRYNRTQNFGFELPGVDNSSQVNVRVSFGAKVTDGKSKLIFKHNGKTLPETAADIIPMASESSYEFIKMANTIKSFELSDEDLDFTMTFQTAGSSVTTARLDYMRFDYMRKLRLYNGSIQFRSTQALKSQCYCLPGYSNNIHIWDISNPNNPIEIIPTVSNNTARFVPAQTTEEYIAFDPRATHTSVGCVGVVANQNLHGLATPDLVILTTKEYLSYARSIAQMHEEKDGLTTAVIDHTLVFNEFSSGTPDATAYRRLMKMFFDREGGIQGKQLYLLLFGKGLYDNRKIGERGKYIKYPTLLTYQHGAGTDERASRAVDDYFGFLDDNSGNNVASDKMRVSIGRIPIKSEQEAKDIVSKLQNYVANKDKGTWKNHTCVVADDENYGVHMKQAEDICQILENGDVHCSIEKIYIDAYLAESSAAGRTYPSAKKQLLQTLSDGVFFIDYIGHGSTVAWSHEGLMGIKDFENLYLKRLPLFVTATCDFGRNDHEETSGGEKLCLNPSGGGIGLITTTRVVYISDNHNLNKGVAREVFKRNLNNEYPRLGDILRLAKCNILQTDSNKLNYTLLGDPALRLNYPDHQIKVTEINNQDISQTTPVIQARDLVTIKGEIFRPNGEKATDYNGIICPTVYDSEESIVSYGYGTEGEAVEFNIRDNRLYVGKDSISNGEFEISFRVPREINFADKQGLINLYSYTKEGEEGSGNETNFIVGGFNDSPNEDFDGPQIYSAYLNGEGFENGSTVNESPLFMANVFDESGINISSAGIGHQITLTLDNKTIYTDVSTYFQPSLGEFGRGFIAYPLSDLSAGEHTLKLKIWDTENNSSETTLSFVVEPGQEPTIYDLYADQNPAHTSTNFYLRHNRPDALIHVTIVVYNLMGVEVWRHSSEGLSDMYRSFPTTWDLTNHNGGRVPGGVYVYKAFISTDNEHEATRSRKIAVTGL